MKKSVNIIDNSHLSNNTVDSYEIEMKFDSQASRPLKVISDQDSVDSSDISS